MRIKNYYERPELIQAA